MSWHCRASAAEASSQWESLSIAIILCLTVTLCVVSVCVRVGAAPLRSVATLKAGLVYFNLVNWLYLDVSRFLRQNQCRPPLGKQLSTAAAVTVSVFCGFSRMDSGLLGAAVFTVVEHVAS